VPGPWEKYGGGAAKPKPWEKYGGAVAAEPPEGTVLGKASGQVMSDGEYARGLGANVIQGATGGFGDEAAGISASLGGGLMPLSMGAAAAIAGREDMIPGYAGARDQFRGVRNDFAEKRPVAAAIGQLAGSIPTIVAAPAGRAASYGGRIAQGIGIGAGYGAVAGVGEGEGGTGGRLLSGAMGAGVGGLGGGLVEGIAPVVARALGRSGRPVTPQIRAEADGLPVPVPLTVGQTTGDVGQLAREYNLSRVAEGDRAAGVMREFSNRQQEALGANAVALQERLAAGGPVIERGQGGALASERLASKGAEARAKADALYAEARRLDAEGEMSRVPFGPTDEAAGSVGPNVEAMIPEATADIRFARAPAEKAAPGIINTIQRMGGIRIVDREGRLTSEGSDLRAIFDGKFPPGLINNRTGKPLDYVREALEEQGWFPGIEGGQSTTNDVLNMISGRSGNPNVSRGSRMEANARDRLRSEIGGLGIKRQTPEDLAAGRLANSRYQEPTIEPIQTGGNVPDGAARASRGIFPADEAGNVLGSVYQTLREEGFYLRTLPKVQAEIRDLTRGLQDDGAIPIGRVFQSLKSLSAVQRAGGEEAVAAGKAKTVLERALDDGLDRGLLEGDERAIEAYRAARANYRDFASTFKSRDLVGSLVARDPQQGFALKVKPEEAANFILGSSALNGNKRDLGSGLIKMRGLLGETSPEWNAIRQEAFIRIADKASGAQGPNGAQFSGAKLATAWEKFTRESPEVARTLFSANERRDIGNWVNVARRVTTKDPSVYAPSVSPYSMRRLMSLAGKLPSMLPVVGKYLDGLGALASDAASAVVAQRAVSGRIPAAATMGAGSGAALAGPVAGELTYMRSGRQKP